MGKYMRKSKTTGEVALLDVSHTQSPLGVRTRAKTLALQRLQKSSSTATATFAGGDGGSYLQLRNRRLEKPQVGLEGKKQKHPLKDPNLPNPVKNQISRTSSRLRQLQGHSGNSGSVEERLGEEKKEEIHLQETQNEIKNNSGGKGGVEASFGENLSEFDGRERTTRESTPCSLIRDPDNIKPPGSSTRPKNASEANGRVPNSARKHIPAAHEMNDFFAGTEEKQQRQFIEKYNFDPVKDEPLPGRYEWVKLDR